LIQGVDALKRTANLESFVTEQEKHYEQIHAYAGGIKTSRQSLVA
jgi:hypothetical protein